MSGDLKDSYQTLVLNAKDANDDMVATMNILCGNINMDCAYALFDYWVVVGKGKWHFTNPYAP